MSDTDKYTELKYTELTIDDWYNLKAHQWEEVMHSYCNLVRVNESLRFELDGKHEDGLKAGGIMLRWIEKCEELDAEVKRLRGIIDYIRDIGRLAKQKKGLPSSFLSIMEKVLTTEEYLEWRNEE
jgi:hypothetical protein